MDHIEVQNGITSFVGKGAVDIYRATAIKCALSLYHRTGLKANRAYTPSAMLRAATDITGQSFKRGQYIEAVRALDTWIEQQRARVPVVQH